MDFAASLLTLLIAARSVSKMSYNFYRRIDEAPKELESVAFRSQLVSCTLEQILVMRPMMEDDREQLVPVDLTKVLAMNLEKARGSLLGLKRICNPAGGKMNFRVRLRWAVLDKNLVQEILRTLTEVETDLMLVLQAIDLRISLINRRFIGDFIVAQDKCLRRLDMHLSLQQGGHFSNDGAMSNVNDHATREALQPISLQTPFAIRIHDSQSESIPRGVNHSMVQAMPYRRSYTLEFFALSATIAYNWNSKRSIYSFKLGSRVPQTTARKVLILEMTVRQNMLSWTQISGVYGSLGVFVTASCTSALMIACEKGSLDTVRDIIETRRATTSDRRDMCSCEDEKHRRLQDETPLHPAIRSGNINLAMYLIEAGADVNALGYDFRSPLQLAFSLGFLDIARHLVNKGACTQHIDFHGRTLLDSLLEPMLWYDFTFCEEWEHEIGIPALRYLASLSFDYFDTPSYYGGTALHLIATGGLSYEIWDTMLKYGSRLQTAEKYGRILRDAARGGDTEVLEYILENGRLNENDRSRRTGQTPLCAAIWYGNSASVAILLDKGSDANEVADGSWWPLNLAIRTGDCATMSLLLEHGADVNQRDDEDQTPLHLVLLEHDPPLSTEMLTLLLQRGADPHARGPVCSGRLRRADGTRGWEGYAGRMTPWETAHRNGIERFEECVSILTALYDGIVVDEEGDIFWDASDTNPGVGEGGSYECALMEGRQGQVACQLLRRGSRSDIWLH